MGKFFERLFKNFVLAFFFIGFAAILYHALTNQPYGNSDFWFTTGFWTTIYMIIDYLHDWMVARRIKV